MTRIGRNPHLSLQPGGDPEQFGVSERQVGIGLGLRLVQGVEHSVQDRQMGTSPDPLQVQDRVGRLVPVGAKDDDPDGGRSREIAL